MARTTETALVPGNALSIPDERMEMLKAIAEDIGHEVATYIDVMYHEAVEATASSFLLSVRNTIYNEIMSAVRDPKWGETPEQWLKRRAQWRKQWRAMARKNRNLRREA